MLRTASIALAMILALSGQALAQSEFDATGQFYVGWSFGVSEKDQPEPKFGFQVGSSSVPTGKVAYAESGKRSLKLKSEIDDQSSQTFSGVQFRFGQEDPTLRLIDDFVSAIGKPKKPVGSYDLSEPYSQGWLEEEEASDDQWLIGQKAEPFSYVSSPISRGDLPD